MCTYILVLVRFCKDRGVRPLLFHVSCARLVQSPDLIGGRLGAMQGIRVYKSCCLWMEPFLILAAMRAVNAMACVDYPCQNADARLVQSPDLIGGRLGPMPYIDRL